MTRLGFFAAVAMAAGIAAGPAGADTAPAPPALFEDGAFPSVDDAELAAAFGRGVSVDSLPDGGGPESRLAIILWDETKPRMMPTSSLVAMERSGGSVVISVGAGPGSTP